jgi:excisionase family DNA binding protein
MNPEDARHLLTRDEVCQRLGVSTKTLRRMVGSGKLPVVRFSRTSLLRFRECDVRRFVESHTHAGPLPGIPEK